MKTQQETIDAMVAEAVGTQSIKMVEYKALLTMNEDRLRSRFAKVLIAVTQSAAILLVGSIGLLATVGIGLLIRLAIWGY